MINPNKPYSPGTLLELTEWSEFDFPKGLYLVLTSKPIKFINGESVNQYTILFPDGSVEYGNEDSYWVRKSFRRVNSKDYE